jgi:Mg2+-importing ATPase
MAVPSSTPATAAPGASFGRRRSVRWISWLLAAAILASVVFVTLHFSEGRDFADILAKARPWWLLLAFLLQAATYAAQGEVFRVGVRGYSVPRHWLFQLSIVKLFMDQALPSGGISSTALAATALERQGIARTAAVSSAMLNMVSYYTSYVAALAVAVFFAGYFGRAAMVILVLALLFLAFGIGITVTILLLAGGRRLPDVNILRLPVVKHVLEFLQGADPAIVRNPRRLAEVTIWQIVIFLLDAATVWVLIRSLGDSAPVVAVFASFVVSSLFRTMGFAPGGLGTYEAASIFTLRMIGLRFSVALSATLLFRGLSFWLPMLPGLWLSRVVTRFQTPEGHEATGAP